MQIREVKTESGYTRGLGLHDFGSNKIDFLTGPNGSGKTILLNSVLCFFRKEKSKDSEPSSLIYTINNANYRTPEPALPLRVIAQTFSPFSRFPSPKAEQKSLLESYLNDAPVIRDEYICAGIHRGTRFLGSNLSKSVLESSIFRLSQSSRYAEALSSALKVLKFSSRLTFVYSEKKVLSDILKSNDRKTAIENLIFTAYSSPSAGRKPRSALGIEATISDQDDLLNIIDSAIEQLDRIRVAKRRLELNFDFNNRHLHDFATLQSLSLLRKLGLLNLTNCSTGGESHSKSDISQSSSGQQQILCSLLSLISTLADGAVILIDEPELSLHPTWQQLYFDMLTACISPFSNCHVIVATHSPLIVQRAQNGGAGIIKMGQANEPPNTKNNKADENSSVEDALLDIFETPITDSVEMAGKIFSAITKAEGGSPLARKQAMDELTKLRQIYSKSPTQDYKALALITDAYEMLLTN